MEPGKDLLRAGRELQSKRDLDGAARIYEGILESEPEQAGALHALGALLNERGNFRRAIGLLKRAVVLRPCDPVRHVDLGESYRNLGEYRRAIGCCRIALRLRPKYPEGFNTLGLALRGAGERVEALEQFRTAISLRPDFSPAHNNAGMVLQELGFPEEAINHLWCAAELEPDSALTRTNLGLALLASSRCAEALTLFQEAIRLRPDLAVAHHNLGNSLRILGRPCEARASYRVAMHLDPRSALTCLHIGMIFRYEGGLDEALDWYKLAVDLAPDNWYLWEELAGLHDERDEPAASDECRRRVIELTPTAEPVAPIDTCWLSPQDERSDEAQGRNLSKSGADTDWAQMCFCPVHVGIGLGFQPGYCCDEATGRPWGVGLDEPALAKANLGLAFVANDQPAEALTQFLEAAALRPDLAALHQSIGDALRLLNHPVEGRDSYLEALRLDPELSHSYLHVGLTLMHEGALDQALSWCKLAVDMEPGNHGYWEELANLYLKRDEPDRAVECRRRVLELVDNACTRTELGWALQEDGRPEEAMEQYLVARGIEPNAPQVHLALSGLYEERGDLSEAERAARTATKLQPRSPAGFARLATLLRGQLPHDDLEVIERRLAGTQLAPQAREGLLFALAHVLDARGAYSRAAACLKEANTRALESKRAEGVVYRPDGHERFVGRLIEIFDRDFFRRTIGLGLATQRPVFVVGLPRTGTTLIEQILASHPQVYGVGERFFGRMSFEAIPAALGRNWPPIECVASLDEYSLKRLAGEHLAKLNALDLGRYTRIVDKLPDNFMYLGLLRAMFPNAVFIHCRRDLRDVAVSCWMCNFRSIRWANDPAHIASRIRQYRRLSAHWQNVLPTGVIEVDYEDTVSDLETVARRLLEACRLPWDPACLDFYKTRRVVRTASLTQVRQPIYSRSVGRWRNYKADLADLFAAIAPDVHWSPGANTGECPSDDAPAPRAGIEENSGNNAPIRAM